MELGHICNPIKSKEELLNAIVNNKNTTLYCRGIFEVTEEMEKELKKKNIKLGND